MPDIQFEMGKILNLQELEPLGLILSKPRNIPSFLAWQWAAHLNPNAILDPRLKGLPLETMVSHGILQWPLDKMMVVEEEKDSNSTIVLRIEQDDATTYELMISQPTQLRALVI